MQTTPHCKKMGGPKGEGIYKLLFTLSRLSFGIYIYQHKQIPKILSKKLQKDMHNKVPFRLILLCMVMPVTYRNMK